MAWLNDIVTLVTRDPSFTFGTNLYTSTKGAPPQIDAMQPATAGGVLKVVETSGAGQLNTQNVTNQPSYSIVSAQLTVAAIDYPTAYAMIKKALTQLLAIKNQFVNGVWYLGISSLQEPFDSGLDDRAQSQCRVNITAIKRFS